MKSRPPVLWIVVAINLVVLVVLAFVHPHLMVSPGPLVKGHEELTTDCFACHAAWRGASSRRCTGCHALADVGLKTTRGEAIPMRTVEVSFHQALVEQDCMACHSDHQGPKLTRRSRKPFSHALLEASVKPRCATCHAAPKDPIHRDPRAPCSQCHGDEAWKPATFDHGAYFVLDRDHQAPCETCHRNHDDSRYTCYGCHEHSEAQVRAEHVKEGIRDFGNCVECHRDPRAEPKKGRGREPGGRERD